MVSFKTLRNEGIDMALYILKNTDIDLNHLSYGKYNALGEFARTRIINEFLDLNKVIEILVSLLEKGFDINQEQGDDNGNAFTLSCKAQSWPIVTYLISKGADYSKEFNYIGCRSDMYIALFANQILDPKSKREILNKIKTLIFELKEPYGKYKKSKDLYIDLLTKKTFKYNY